MIRGFYAAASGLISQQANMSVIANNIANVNTSGFKEQQTGFSSLIYKSLNGGNEINYVGTGHGVKIEQTNTDFTQAELASTDIDTDYAILGTGFFAVQDPESEEIYYTRDGSFQISTDGSTSYLKDSAGNNVLNADGDAIEYTSDSDEETDTTAVTPGVYVFPNQYGLKPIGGNTYAATTLSGEAEVVDPTDEDAESVQVVSGYLENSGVDISLEMVHMIEASKGFSFNAKIIQAADDMEKIVNQLR